MQECLHTALARTLSVLVGGGVLLSLGGCGNQDGKADLNTAQHGAEADTATASKHVTLESEFLTRALAALGSRLTPESQILEFQITGDIFSVHMLAPKDLPASDQKKAIRAGALVQVDYVERATEPGQPPLGKIYGPRPITKVGEGEVQENIFPLSEVDLAAIGRAFPAAKTTIDPIDGQIERVVIRRNLPFGKRVRGRIFVASPRLSGSIDVNEKGAVLKR